MDNYNKLFLNQLCLRDCCGESCVYRNSERVADITIADLNNFVKLYPKVCDEKSYSTIVINTEKGKKIFDKLTENMIILPLSLDDIEKENPLFFYTTSENSKRTLFFDDFLKRMSIKELCDKYCTISSKSYFYYLKGFIPYGVKYFIRRIKLAIMEVRR